MEGIESEAIALERGHPRPFHFTDTLKQDYLLLEVTEDLLQEIEASGVCIKGQRDEDAVLCTSSATYSVKVVGTTNTVLLGRDCKSYADFCANATQSDVAPTQLGNFPGVLTQQQQVAAVRDTPPFVVSASCSSHLELQEIGPDSERLRSMLAESVYTGEETDGALARASCAVDEMESPPARRVYSLGDLLANVRASEAQLWSLLHAMEALELDGHWRLIDPALQSSILEYTLLTAVQKGWSLRSVPLEPAADVLLEEGGFDKRVSVHCLRMHDAARASAEEASGSVDLSGTRTCRHYGSQLLLAKAPAEWEVEDFMTSWRRVLPEGFQPCLAMLQGLYLASPCGSRVKHFPASALPPAPAARFAALFSERPLWAREDLRPFVADLAQPGQTLEALLLRHSRLVQPDPRQPALHASR